MKSLPQSFYDRPTLDVARDLIGAELSVRTRASVYSGRIVEAEAYVGEEDPACHAHRGLTPRTRVMYGPPGHAYVYFTYGNHWMLNFVTEREGFPAAVLIRAIEPIAGVSLMRRRRQVTREFDLTNGPGKLTSALGINGDDNGADLQGPRFQVLLASRPRLMEIATSGRIGVNEGFERPWRFYLQGSPWVSKYRSTPYARAASGTLSQKS